MLALLQRLRRGARARGGYFFKIRKLRLEASPRELFVLTRTGLFQCWGDAPMARPPAACRVSELERPQCNCALGPFLLIDLEFEQFCGSIVLILDGDGECGGSTASGRQPSR